MSGEFPEGNVCHPIDESPPGHLQEGSGAVNAGQSKVWMLSAVVLEFFWVMCLQCLGWSDRSNGRFGGHPLSSVVLVIHGKLGQTGSDCTNGTN